MIRKSSVLPGPSSYEKYREAIMAKTSTKPGRGRKQCTSCKLYIGVRSKTCPSCGHEFTAADKAAREAKKAAKAQRKVTTYDGPGKGRKKCSDCGTYVAARTSTCVCGHDFTASRVKVIQTGGSAPAEDTNVANDNTGTGNRRIKGNEIIAIPAGKCPVKLDNTDADTVIEWAKAVQDTEKDTLSIEALDYWSRTQGVAYGSEEHTAVKTALKVYGREVGLIA